MRLVIAEKPSVAQSIAAVLGAKSRHDGYLEGGGYIVSWCFGHLAELADAAVYNADDAKWTLAALPIIPTSFRFIVRSEKQKQFDILRELMRREDVAEVVNACDAGREGELIFRTAYCLAGCSKPILRLWISSMEDDAIRSGFQQLRIGRDYNGLHQSALCRAKADWLVGINATRYFSLTYEKLANISCGKNDGMFRCDNLVLDDAVDVQGCCRKAEELFELYQRCANRKQIETICVNFLRGMEATKLSVTGHMYFVPRTFMERVDIFEDFITLLSGLNKKQTPLVVNSFYIIDDAKQRDKMTEEFYLAVKKEIAAYQEKCDYLIKSSSQSPAVMERWVLKVQALEEKKRHYEGVLQRELDGLDDEFSVLKLLSQELQVRARSIRSQRFQQRAA